MDIAQIRDKLLIPQDPAKRVRMLICALGVLVVLPLGFCNRDPLKKRQKETDPTASARHANESATAEQIRQLLAEAERKAKAIADTLGKKPTEPVQVQEPAAEPPSAPPRHPSPRPLPEAAKEEDTNRGREREERKAQIVVISNRVAPLLSAAGTQSPSSQPPATPTDQLAAARNQAPERPYRVREGTLIDAVLINALDGEFTGPVECLVTTAVRADDSQVVLIPIGARVLGKASRVDARAQQRLAITFHRIEFPNGLSVQLDNAVALNQAGETGLRDKVDRHWGRVVADSVAHAVINGFGARTVIYNGQGASRAIDDIGQVLPTLTIRQGYIVKIALSRDLFLPAYTSTEGGPHQ